jgi:DMSO/TMAO reductase YedYZ molybdopterin-dependent catalytic subunit
MNGITRREYFALALAGPAIAGKRQLGNSPVISVQDFEQYPSLLTPAGDFFVRNHFEIPTVDVNAWRLQVGGLVERELTFSIRELESMPQVEVTSVIECAGNGAGVGAVGCAAWGGVRLGELLRACGLKRGAKFVAITGADRGREPDSGEVQYKRALALEDALGARTLVALRAGGEPLSMEHGAPARIIAAGRYGMDSVKWIESIRVLDAPDDSFFMQRRFRRVRGGKAGELVGPIVVKSIVAKPVENAALRGASLLAGGFAWAGADIIGRVDVRLDGDVWTAAKLLSAPALFGWVAWQFEVRRLRPGMHTIESRAVTRTGHVQPARRDPLREDDYELNQVQRVRFSWRP